MRQLSANDGGVSSVITTSASAPIAARSQRPRTGSRSRRAKNARISVGATNTMNGSRHPNRKASRPATNGPTNAPTALAARWVLYTRLREANG